MASNSPNRDTKLLSRLAAKTRVICRDVCGGQAQIVCEAKNLYSVLRRLQQEASRDGSALTKPGATCREDLLTLCYDCRIILSDTNSFLLAHKTLGQYEAKILGSWHFATFTDTQKAIIGHFRSKFMQLALRLSKILIMASRDSLGGLDEQVDHNKKYALSAILNDLTSLLVANNDVRLSMIVKDPRNEQILWEALRQKLLEKGLEEEFLDQHKKIILIYVRALERRSAFSKQGDVQTDGPKGKPVKTEPADRSASLGKCEEDRSLSPHSRKRARSAQDDSPERPHGSVNASLQSLPSDQAPRNFRFRDPKTVFSPDVDDDKLANFLEEEPDPSRQLGLRDQLRDIYRTLDDDYYLRYELWIVRGFDQEEEDERESRALPWELEHLVVGKLDELELGNHPDLRRLRKMMIIKAQKMLGDLDTAR